ncbi:hypothetical protein [Streptomyces sp. WAC 01529]|uniref:hypothetical protein n=1 Tax=Streptomyces sp. WAC 01529 TaxID=2203205 RepID=UPI0019D227F0|nr:hypothetical protein [Streptomyces sp. WAC 01529]
MGRRLGGGWGAAAVCAVVGAAGVFPGQAWGAGTPAPYGFAEGAETIDGAVSNVEGRRLSPGKVYRSALPRAGQRFYRLELGAEESAYVAVTAVPAVGSKVSYADGVEVSVQDADGNNCSPLESQEARFGASESPRPLTATAARRVGPDEKSCVGAGTYYVLVERVGAPESSRESWDLELRVASEPALRTEGPTAPPRSWNSASPVAPVGERKVREGGTSFNRARALGRGVWGDSIGPGETLFYRVPVDWGQRLSVGAELGSSRGAGGGGGGRGGRGYVSSALVMAVANPVRAEVDDVDTAYDGKQKSAVLDPLPPVAYENRFAPEDGVAAMRFAGWYYVSVHLSAEVAETFGGAPVDLTLRVDVDGAARPGPAYAGSSVPAGEFDVTERDAEAARRGETAVGGDDRAMAVLAVGGIGAGVVLLGVLAGWTLIARRRAAVETAAPGGGQRGAGGVRPAVRAASGPRGRP